MITNKSKEQFSELKIATAATPEFEFTKITTPTTQNSPLLYYKKNDLTDRFKDDPLSFIQRKLVGKLIKEIRNASQQSNVTTRKQILREIYANLSCKIEPDFRHQMKILISPELQEQQAVDAKNKRNSLGQEKMVFEVVGTEGPFEYYYELVSDYFYRNQNEARKLQPLMEDLRSNIYLASIYALLFFKWLFSSRNDELNVNRLFLFLKGTNRLFWSDLMDKTIRFRTIYKFIKHDVLLTKNKSTIFENSDDCVSIIAKYFFFYEMQSGKVNMKDYIQLVSERLLTVKAESNHQHSASSAQDYHTAFEEEDDEDEFQYSISSSSSPDTSDTAIEKEQSFNSSEEEELSPAEQVEMHLSDIFVHENILLLSSIQDEQTLLVILKNYRYFANIKISTKMKLKLQSALYSLWRPGGPRYPTKAVRHKASEIIDLLFPGGRLVRFLVNASFRVLHQYTWPKSLFMWTCSGVWKVATFPMRYCTKITKEYQRIHDSFAFVDAQSIQPALEDDQECSVVPIERE